MTGRPSDAANSDHFGFKALGEANNYRRALMAEFSEHLRGRVLEVGAGVGQITRELRQNRAITELTSIEPNPRFCAQLRAAFPSHKIVEGTIADMETAKSWDAILSLNVLEHIEQDEPELRYYRRLLMRGTGVLCLFVPARPEIFAPLDRDFGHLRRYTRVGLREKLERAGFEILRLRYYNIAGYFAWWLNFRVLRRRGFGSSSVRFFDRVIFPPMNGIESRLCPPPIGQSLLAIAGATVI